MKFMFTELISLRLNITLCNYIKNFNTKKKKINNKYFLFYFKMDS